MKKVHLVLVLAVFCGSCLFLNNCGQQNSSSSSSASFSSLFYNNASNTTPVFIPISVSSVSVKASAATWGSGNPLYSVYFSLREFLHSRDEGKVDRSNLYKLLYDVDTVFSGISSEAITISEAAVTPPFSKLPGVVCNKAINDAANKRAIAMKETSTEVDGIITWIWSGSSTQDECGIATVQYNKSTKDITIDMSYSVDYDLSTTATDYNLRCKVTGNAGTHEFQYKYIIGDNKIVAKGISQGAGNYMLFKYTGGSDPVKYVVATAEASEGFFADENSNPANIYTNEASLPSTVAAYKDWVTAEAFFTSSDLMSDKSTLNSGNSKAGTIYINY